MRAKRIVLAAYPDAVCLYNPGPIPLLRYAVWTSVRGVKIGGDETRALAWEDAASHLDKVDTR